MGRSSSNQREALCAARAARSDLINIRSMMARSPRPAPLRPPARSRDRELARSHAAYTRRCRYITATLGVADALKYLNGMLRCGAPESSLRPLTPVRHAYLANKSFRDFVRLQAVVLFQKDYENAWLLRGGRPTPAELRRLADAFLAKDGRCCTARETLAWLEVRPGRDRAALGSLSMPSGRSRLCPRHGSSRGMRSPLHTQGWLALVGCDCR